MNKKILSLLCLLCLIISIPAVASADPYTSEVGTVWFNSDGKTMGNDFQKNLSDDNVENALKERMKQLQPGDEVTFVINLRNDYSSATNWYMTSKIVDSLEEGTAKDGAYTYYLRYVNNTNSANNRELFRSETVGGDSSTGLMEVNKSLKEDYDRNGDGEIDCTGDRLQIRINCVAFIVVESLLKGSDKGMTPAEYEAYKVEQTKQTFTSEST